jgi:hypothetical protein
MKKSIVLMIGLVLTLGFSGSVSAITDPGTNYGPLDLTEVEVEVYDRGDLNLLKLSITSTPNLPGVVIFESDVDNSTGTGGSISTIGAPVSPCPCKTEPGFDVAVSIFTRQQGDSSGSAVAASCSDNQGECGRRRESGEWYALTSLGGQPIRAIGILRGYLDPLPASPTSGATEDCYTIPWSHIVAYANSHQQETDPTNPKNFSFVKARANNYVDGKWQVSIFYDDTNYATDEDDVASGTFPTQTFDINDYAPDVGKADTIDSGGAANPAWLTYCEGNFDGDKDVDGGDAAKFKANFGRSPFKNPCPACGPNY